MSSAPPCRICHATEGATYTAREMMFGTRETFSYFQCDRCGCLQIAEFPADLGRFYPAEYYSFSMKPWVRTGVRGLLWRARNRYAYARRGLAGRVLHTARPRAPIGSTGWVTRRGVNLDARILDVGSGSGTLLFDLHAAGYRNLLGVDPFLDADIHHPNGITVLKRGVHEMEGEFDVIMLHHVLEHVPDQQATLATLERLLAPGGYILIRIPVVRSEAWEKYGVDWVQLDAPRHLFLHTAESMTRLADEAGLRMEAVEYDSTAFQFAASELYRRDVPLVEQEGKTPPATLRDYTRRAAELNRSGRGDQAAFYLSRR